MNTSITSENETANSLIELLETYDNINISGVSKIIGTPSEMGYIIDTGKFTGFDTTNLVVIGPANLDNILYLEANTTGTIEHEVYDTNVVASPL